MVVGARVVLAMTAVVVGAGIEGVDVVVTGGAVVLGGGGLVEGYGARVAGGLVGCHQWGSAGTSDTPRLFLQLPGLRDSLRSTAGVRSYEQTASRLW